MFNLNDQQLTQLAMEYDPAPVLTAFASMPSGNFLTMPQPQGVQPGQGMSYEDLIAGYPTQAAQKPLAPLDPASLRTLAAMNPAAPPRAPAAAPMRFPQVALQPVVNSPKAVPMSLAQILGR